MLAVCLATCRGSRCRFCYHPWGGSIFRWEPVPYLSESVRMCAKFGCGPTVVSKKRGVQTDRQRNTAQLYIVEDDHVNVSWCRSQTIASEVILCSITHCQLQFTSMILSTIITSPESLSNPTISFSRKSTWKDSPVKSGQNKSKATPYFHQSAMWWSLQPPKKLSWVAAIHWFRLSLVFSIIVFCTIRLCL